MSSDRLFLKVFKIGDMEMPCLDIEKRMGVTNSEIDDFLSKVNAVEEAIKGLKEGKLDPAKEIKIPGIKTESELKRDAKRKEKEEQLRQKREAERQMKLKAEEKDKWWRGAELMYGDRGRLVAQDEALAEAHKCTAKHKDVRLLAQRYESDYSRWEDWTPDDPASLAEAEDQRLEKEKMQNEAFEKANAGFCGQFKEDMQQREEAQKKKDDSASSLRLKGNRWFKAKQLDKASVCYMDSLKVAPFKVETLTNVAQVHIRMKAWDDAVEFCDRALHVNPCHVKALSRRAVAHKALGNTGAALKDLQAAARVEPVSHEVARQLDELTREIKDRETEKEIERLKHGRGAQSSQPRDLGGLLSEGADALNDPQALGAAGLVTMDRIMSDVKGSKLGKELNAALSTLAALVMASPNHAAYLRTSGTLEWLCQKGIGNTTDGAQELYETHDVAKVLAVLWSAVEDDETNRLVLLRCGVLPVLSRRLGSGDEGKDAQDMALKVLQSCMETDDCMKAVAGSEEMMQMIFSSMANATRAGVIQGIAGLLRDALLTDAGKMVVIALKDCRPVDAVAGQLVKTQPVESSKPLRETLCAALANLALVEGVRPSFAGLPCKGLLSVCRSGKDTAAAWAFALAALMNACLEPSMMVRRDLVAQGGVELCGSLLKAPVELRKKLGSSIWTRSAGLLARLSGCPEGQTRIMSSGVVNTVRDVLREGSDVPSVEQEHLCRTFAAVVAEANAAELMEAAVVAALVKLLPQPRVDPVDLTVTSETVSLTPKRTISDQLAASVTKCLIPAVAPGMENKTVMSAFKEAQGVERIVCLLANAKDGPVRKNVAIVLARLMKGDAAAAERIRDLRGMEMILQLGNRLV